MSPKNTGKNRAAAPFLLELVLSNRCNMDCTYCSSGFMIHEKEKKVFSFVELRRAVDVYAACLEKNGLRGRGLISFTGNEPLLEFELLRKVVRYVRSRHDGIRMRLDTNGTLLTPARTGFLLANGVRVFVSLDGCRKAHDRHRIFPGGRGSTFDVILGNLEKIPERLRRAGDFCVWAVITPETIEFLPESLEFFRRLGFGVVVLCLETYGRWDRAAAGRLRAAFRELRDELPRALARPAGPAGDGTQFLFGRSEAEDYRGIVGNAVSLAMDGNFYPCDFALIPPFRPECRVGSLEKGLDLGRLEKIVRLPMFGRMSEKCAHRSGLRSPVERYYWGLAHKYSAARLDGDLADTSRINRLFNEEMGGYLKVRDIYERLVSGPSFGDFAHAPRYAGDKGARRCGLAAGAGSDAASLRAGLDFFLCAPGAAKTLELAAADGSAQARATLEALAVYALAKTPLLGKRLRLAFETGAAARREA